MSMVIAVTGHRPEELKQTQDYLYKLFLDTFLESNPEKVIVGMAAGIDLIAGYAAIGGCFDVIAAVPYKGHKPRKGDEQRYDFIMQFASEVVYVNDAESYPGAWVYPKRNEWMVNNATHLLAYYNGSPKGGTAHCVKYATGKIPIRNIYGK